MLRRHAQNASAITEFSISGAPSVAHAHHARTRCNPEHIDTMKLPSTFLFLLALAAPMAQAMTIDPKALARFDHGYIVCEAKNPAMKGQRDEAYLSLWKVKPDPKARAELAAARKTAGYRSEQALVQKRDAKGAAPAASSPIEQQCQALWAETQGMAKKKQ